MKLPTEYPDIHSDNLSGQPPVRRERAESFPLIKDTAPANDAETLPLGEVTICRNIEDFLYENITRGSIKYHPAECCDFLSLPKSIDKTTQKPFAELYCQGNVTDITVGWKFHINLNQDIPGNIIKGWNCILKILIENNIGKTKIILPNNKASDDKVITIYSCIEKKPRSLLMWQSVINHIVQALVDNKVVPGKLPDEYKIAGCIYVTYRNDLGHDGKYSEKNNVTNQPNPFLQMIVNVEGQENLIALGEALRSRKISYPAIPQRSGEPYPLTMIEENESEENANSVEIPRQFESNMCTINKEIKKSEDYEPEDGEDNTNGCCC